MLENNICARKTVSKRTFFFFSLGNLSRSTKMYIHETGYTISKGSSMTSVLIPEVTAACIFFFFRYAAKGEQLLFLSKRSLRRTSSDQKKCQNLNKHIFLNITTSVCESFT